jgi:hypothetical protein
METSDFLTILGLGLAVWALIPQKQAKFILSFFSKFEIFIFILSLFFIHYLMSFDWVLNTWFPSLSIFTTEKGIPSIIWAYIVSLLVVTYPIIKVAFGFFSESRVKNLIDLYKTYLKESEIDLLVNFINKYHILDIHKYLKGLSNLPKKENIDIVLRRRTESDWAYEKLTKPKRILFASWVYGNILQNEAFVKNSANKYPELFAIAFSGMETEKSCNPSLVKLYIESIFESKNYSFIQELKILNDSYDSIKERNESIDLPILYSLLSHTIAAKTNNVWYPVGEGAIKSLKYDEEQKNFLQRKYDSDIKDDLWNQKIYIAIAYFNYMVRETIYRNNEWHMWLFYYQYFLKHLIKLIPSDNEYDMDSSYPSFIHFVIEEEFTIMLEWLQLSIEQNNDNRVIDTVRCLGNCISQICEANNTSVSENFKSYLIDLVLSKYFDFSHYHDNAGALTAMTWIEQMFLNPKDVDRVAINRPENYLYILQKSWNEFDKIPYQEHNNNGIIERFSELILRPLQLNE